MAMDGYRGFLGLLVSALLVGFLSVLFTLIWVLHYREGLGWNGGALEFNWHPVLAVTGFVFIQGIGTGHLPGAGGGARVGGPGKPRIRRPRDRAGAGRAGPGCAVTMCGWAAGGSRATG
jgi:hypothetical protein